VLVLLSLESAHTAGVATAVRTVSASRIASAMRFTTVTSHLTR